MDGPIGEKVVLSYSYISSILEEEGKKKRERQEFESDGEDSLGRRQKLMDDATTNDSTSSSSSDDGKEAASRQYRCSRCGEIKNKHVCPFKSILVHCLDSATQTGLYWSQDVKFVTVNWRANSSKPASSGDSRKSSKSSSSSTKNSIRSYPRSRSHGSLKSLAKSNAPTQHVLKKAQSSSSLGLDSSIMPSQSFSQTDNSTNKNFSGSKDDMELLWDLLPMKDEPTFATYDSQDVNMTIKPWKSGQEYSFGMSSEDVLDFCDMTTPLCTPSIQEDVFDIVERSLFSTFVT